ncbi:MAG: nucleoside 2-deoxyribosyltransferase [Anaerolineaceae bacterium]|nr:nucleoside 2-deoxyribosyltransferase [Anaerolineaceae bacterium]
MRAYIAGPLFNEGERWFDEQIDAIARQAGLDTFLPHRDGGEAVKDGDTNEIFKVDVAEIDRADLVIANLNGAAIDDGTAWEMGYAYAKGKQLIGVYTDARLSFRGQVVNLMLEKSCAAVVRSLDELEAVLKALSAGG